MKKLFVTLLTMLCVTTSLYAQKPENVIRAIDKMAAKQSKENVTYERTKDFETGKVESLLQCVKFTAKANDPDFIALKEAFLKDEKVAYNFTHLDAAEPRYLSIETKEGGSRLVRSQGQELWMMNVKSTEDPRYRDCYLMTWNKSDGKGEIVHSYWLRPNFTLKKEETVKAAESTKFIIEGRVDEEIKDSCYNIYISDFHSNITDKNLVACVPVVDKRFHYEVDLDEVKAGRLRCIFPGNELCSAWIDLHFIPGFTMYITVHNGFYNLQNMNAYQQLLQEKVYKNNRVNSQQADTVAVLEADEYDPEEVEEVHIGDLDILDEKGGVKIKGNNASLLVPKKQMKMMQQQIKLKEMQKEIERTIMTYVMLLELNNKELKELTKSYSQTFDIDERQAISKRTKNLHKKIEKLSTKLSKYMEKNAQSLPHKYMNQ